MIDFLRDPQNSNLIQAVSAIGAFVAAIVSLLTLRLIRTQIKNAQRPNVIIGNSCSGHCSPAKNGKFNINWSLNERSPIEGYDVPMPVAFELVNVGIGFAENVKILESYDIKKAIKFIKNLDTKNEFDITFLDSILRIKANFDEEWIRIPISNSERSLGNINTIQSNGGRPDKYVLDDSYLAFLSCFSRIRQAHNEFANLDEFPKLKMVVSFSDIDGKKYKNRFYCNPFAINSTYYSFRFIKD